MTRGTMFLGNENYDDGSATGLRSVNDLSVTDIVRPSPLPPTLGPGLESIGVGGESSGEGGFTPEDTHTMQPHVLNQMLVNEYESKQTAGSIGATIRVGSAGILNEELKKHCLMSLRYKKIKRHREVLNKQDRLYFNTKYWNSLERREPKKVAEKR